MIAQMTQIIGSTVAVALLVAALWGWGEAPRIADNAHRPDVVVWAVRSAAVSAAAGAQALLLTFAVGAVYRRGLFDELLRLVAGLVCTVALVSAITLALAGR